MSDLRDGEVHLMQGSGKAPYQLKNVGGVYSCSCPAWRNQSLPIERRSCKHLRKLRGDAAESARIGSPLAPIAKPKGGVSAPDLMLAESWNDGINPTGYWMSEKMDGVRALWRGKTREFITRKGNIYLAPDWFTEGLPSDLDLDGELWMGQKQFQRTVSIVRRQDKSDDWKLLRFMVFDSPTAPGLFEARAATAEEILRGVSWALWHEHVPCTGLRHLQKELRRVEQLGGEGLMLRAPKSRYDAGRTSTLLKVKSVIDDEAEVIGFEEGKGRHKDRMGALRCRMENGKEFSVGTGFTDHDRNDPPRIGSTIKFKYQELTDGGTPRFPVYLGLREE